jgi:hypothetical protein
MGRTVRSSNYDRTPYVKPVERVELSEKNLKWRLLLVVLLIMIAAGSFAYGINALLSKDAGWQEIHANSRKDAANCSEDFVFMYNLGAIGASATVEGKAIVTHYTDATELAYQLFHTKESFEHINNIYYINRHPNEEIVVDEVLYNAFDLISQYNNRNIYMGPVYMLYDDIFYCQEDYQLTDFDPYVNSQVAEDYKMIASYANNPDMIDIQLLGNNTIKLFVSDEYLNYAKENEIEDYIDFFWMKNAFIVDYLADLMIESGYTRGSISSYDGFVRNMDITDTSYSFNIYDRVGQTLELDHILEYTGPLSLVYYRDYAMNSRDYNHYYELDNSEIRTAYVDVKDGLSKEALSSLYLYSDSKRARYLFLCTSVPCIIP